MSRYPAPFVKGNALQLLRPNSTTTRLGKAIVIAAYPILLFQAYASALSISAFFRIACSAAEEPAATSGMIIATIPIAISAWLVGSRRYVASMLATPLFLVIAMLSVGWWQ